MRSLVIALLALLSSLPDAGPLQGAEHGERSHRVVVHVNSGDEAVQRGVLNNIRHLFQAVGRDHLMLEVVAHGAGLRLFIRNETSFAQALRQIHAEYGVAFTACSNTMKSMQLSREDLIQEVGDTVPAMVRLMERQEQGWAYIKP